MATPAQARPGIPAQVLVDLLIQALQQATVTIQEIRAIERQVELLRVRWELRRDDARQIRRFLATPGAELPPTLLDGAQTALLDLLEGGVR